MAMSDSVWELDLNPALKACSTWRVKWGGSGYKTFFPAIMHLSKLFHLILSCQLSFLCSWRCYLSVSYIYLLFMQLGKILLFYCILFSSATIETLEFMQNIAYFYFLVAPTFSIVIFTYFLYWQCFLSSFPSLPCWLTNR